MTTAPTIIISWPELQWVASPGVISGRPVTGRCPVKVTGRMSGGYPLDVDGLKNLVTVIDVTAHKAKSLRVTRHHEAAAPLARWQSHQSSPRPTGTAPRGTI